MKKISFTVAAISIFLPTLIFAEDFSGYINQMIERAQQGEGVMIESHSSVSTGGQVAGSGQTVVTDGDVSASSHIETRINAGNEGDTVEVKVETSKNGEKKIEEYTKQIPKGEPVNVNAAAHVNTEATHIESTVNGETIIESHEGTTSQEHIATNVEAVSRLERAVRSVPGFFKKVLSFFLGW